MWWLVRFGGISKGSEEGSSGGGGKVVKLRLNPELRMVHMAPQSSNPLSCRCAPAEVGGCRWLPSPPHMALRGLP